MHTVFKKALQCVSYKEWEWKCVIVEMTCDSFIKLSNSNICRAPHANVVAIHPCPVQVIDAWSPGQHAYEGMSGFVNDGTVVSWYTHDCVYTPGKKVVADKFDSDTCNHFSNGIHFFLTRQEAESYLF